jgi:hypothetical protein
LVTLYELVMSEETNSADTASKLSRLNLLTGLLQCSKEQLDIFSKHLTQSTNEKVRTSSDCHFENRLSNLASIFHINQPDEVTDISTQTSTVSGDQLVRYLFGPILRAVTALSTDGDFVLARDFQVYERVGALCAVLRATIRLTLLFFSSRLRALQQKEEGERGGLQLTPGRDGGALRGNDRSTDPSKLSHPLQRSGDTTRSVYALRVARFEEMATLRASRGDFEQWVLEQIGGLTFTLRVCQSI